MKLSSLRLRGFHPFDDATLSFVDSEGVPLPLTLLFGASGTGKTAALTCIASTRPGYAPYPRGPRSVPTAMALAAWSLGAEDPARPHPLRVATPSAELEGESAEEQLFRRREQMHFEKLAEKGGFLLCTISGARSFGREAVVLGDPLRFATHHDPKQAPAFDDLSRAELARDTKKVLAYASISRSLGDPNGRLLDEALHAAVATVLASRGLAYEGVSPRSFEPRFIGPRGDSIPFEELPRGAKHAVAMVALPLRALFAGTKTVAVEEDSFVPLRAREVVVLVDDVDLHQEPEHAEALLAALPKAIPGAQWIVSSDSRALASHVDPTIVRALRARHGSGDRAVDVHDGQDIALH